MDDSDDSSDRSYLARVDAFITENYVEPRENRERDNPIIDSDEEYLARVDNYVRTLLPTDATRVENASEVIVEEQQPSEIVDEVQNEVNRNERVAQYVESLQQHNEHYDNTEDDSYLMNENRTVTQVNECQPPSMISNGRPDEFQEPLQPVTSISATSAPQQQDHFVIHESDIIPVSVRKYVPDRSILGNPLPQNGAHNNNHRSGTSEGSSSNVNQRQINTANRVMHRFGRTPQKDDPIARVNNVTGSIPILTNVLHPENSLREVTSDPLDDTIEPIDPERGEYPDMFTDLRRELAEQERMEQQKNRLITVPNLAGTSITLSVPDNNIPDHTPYLTPHSDVSTRPSTSMSRAPLLLPPRSKGRVADIEPRKAAPPAVQSALHIPTSTISRDSMETPTPAVKPVSTSATLAKKSNSVEQKTWGAYDSSDDWDSVSMSAERSTRQQQQSQKPVDPVAPIEQPVQRPVQRPVQPPRQPATVTVTTSQLSASEIQRRDTIAAANNAYLLSLTSEYLETLGEEELQGVTNLFYESPPRMKFKLTYPFMAEGIVQKDCDTNQLKVFSSRLGKLMLPDTRPKKSEDYVYFVAIKPGLNAGCWFDTHPECLISAKFPSVDRIVLRGYAILTHPVGAREDSKKENKWICWNDSLGLMSIISGAARTPLKKTPVWDKQLDIISIHANFENRRFVVTKVVGLTNTYEKMKHFPNEVFLVKDAKFKQQMEDDYVFFSTTVNDNIYIKRTLVGEVPIFEGCDFELVVVPTFQNSSKFEFRALLIINMPSTFWNKEKEWIREILVKKTETYRH